MMTHNDNDFGVFALAARRAGLFLTAAGLSVLMCSCSWFMGEVSDDEVKQLDKDMGTPDPRITAYDSALKNFGKMLESYNVQTTKIQSKLISNQTADKTMPDDVSKMLITAVNKIGRPVVYVPYDPQYVIGESTTGGAISRALPELVLEGGITEFDKDMIEKGRKAQAEASVQKGDWGSKYNYDGGAKYEAGSSVSRIAFDLHIMNYTTQAYIPGVQAANAINVRKGNLGWSVGGYFQGCGMSFDYNLQKKQGIYTAIRMLVELSVLETLGRYYEVPYWRCIEGASPNAEMCARIKEDFQEWPENDQTLYLKDYLFLHGYSVDKGVPGLTPRDKQAITDAALKFKTVSNAELFYQLWLNVPLDDARKRLRDSKRPAAAQAVQPAPPPQIQQQIQVQQPQAPQQIQPEVQAAPAPQPQAAPAPEQQAPQAPAPQPRPARKKAPAADGKEAPTGIGASEW